MKKSVELWLMEGPEWIKYAVQNQLLGNDVCSTEATESDEIETIVRYLIENEDGLKSIINGTTSYSKESFWYLYFLSDIGFNASELHLEQELENIINLETERNRYLLSKEMKPDYFCISAIVLTSIARLSEIGKEKIKPHIEMLLSYQRLAGGWHCAKNRAIGRKLESTESCPMDNLNILMLLSEYNEYLNDKRLNGAIDLLLSHWARRSENWRPYGFGIGTQFNKLRYPESKYGILRVLDVLSKYPYAVKSSSFKSMLKTVKEKSVDGRYMAESTMKIFASFDFGQKKYSSQWITFLIERIELRVDNARVQ